MGEAKRKRLASCICGSGNPAGGCCYGPDGWHKAAARVYLKDTGETGSHQRCYMRHLNSCSDKISGEHLISETVLRVLAEKDLDVSGFPWLKGEHKIMRFGALTTNCLCRTHNSALSGLDAAAGRFFAAIQACGTTEEGLNQQYLFSGHDLERWLLKTLAACAASDNLSSSGDKLPGEFHSSVNVTELLEHPEQWVHPVGLFFTQKLGARFKRGDTFSLAPLTVTETNELAGMLVDVQGLTMALHVANRSIKGTGLDQALFRPGGLHFHIGARRHSIHISWNDPHKHGYITMTWEG
jgi:hypothetical protein